MSPSRKVKYACAVLLIISSIALAFIQVFDIEDVADGTLMYIAQAFLLAGSIFGLEYYITKLNRFINGQQKTAAEGNQKLQPPQHTDRQHMDGRTS